MAVVQAATTACLRQAGRAAAGAGPPRWEVLMGQGEVVNWLRSTPEKVSLMRYPGEFKFPGGTVDSGESLEQTALRELQEEFLLDLRDVPHRLRPFNVKQTRAVQGRSYIMHNFLALAEENPWLAAVDCAVLNARLQAKRHAFEAALAAGAFWSLPPAERAALSPEVRAVEWVGLADAIGRCEGSLHPGLTPVNDFQREEFARYGVRRRDWMYQTLATLAEIQQVASSAEALRNHCDRLAQQGPRLTDDEW